MRGVSFLFQYRLTGTEFKNSDQLKLGDLTVIVGPNNSGKSQFLKDISALCTEENPQPVILQSISHTIPESLNDLRASYQVDPEKDDNGNYFIKGFRPDLGGVYSIHVNSSNWEATAVDIISKWDSNPHLQRLFRTWFGHRFVTRLKTEDRLLLTKRAPRTDDNSILSQFYDLAKFGEERLSSWVQQAFGLQMRLDYSRKADFLLRVGSGFDGVPEDPREAQPILEAYLKLDEQGDGLRSFVATAMALIVNRRPVLLLDEPEAFLHPPQAMVLGQIIADVAQEGRQVVVATHSVDILRGILSRRSDIGLVRLSRNSGVSNVTIMDADAVRRVANDPLLSSTRVLDGLFYRGVVVVEADSDSIFYQRVAAKIRSGDEIHYVHAHNKQTLAKVAGPYRKMGLPVAVVPDFDVLRDKTELRALLQAIQAPRVEDMLVLQETIRDEVELQPISARLEVLRQAVEAALDRTSSESTSGGEAEALSDIKRRLKRALEESDKWSRFKRRGRAELSDKAQESFDSIDAHGRAVGLFIVPVGELESWLVDFGLPRLSNKNTWILQALEKLAEINLPEESALAKFVTGLHAYLLD